jgi:phage tail tape-measure protein
LGSVATGGHRFPQVHQMGDQVVVRDTAATPVVEHKVVTVGQGHGEEVGGAVGGAITGAVVGTVVPGIGTVVGAVVGGAVGALAGKVENDDKGTIVETTTRT